MRTQSKQKIDEELWKIVQNGSAIKFYCDFLSDDDLKKMGSFIHELYICSETVLDKTLYYSVTERKNEELC